MLKKIFILALCTLSIFAVNLNLKVPVFSGYAQTFELYLKDSSSLSQIVYADTTTYPFVRDIKGESFTADRENFNLKKFLQEFGGKVVFTENIKEGVVIYAYAPKLKYRTTVKGQNINLQIFIGNQVKVGSPLIYGSF